MKPGWINLDDAADSMSRHTLGRPARTSETKRGARAPHKLLRSLRDLLMDRMDVDVMVRAADRWLSMTEADRMSGIQIAYGLHQNYSKLGAETVHARGVLSDMLIRESTFTAALSAERSEAVDARDVPITFEQMKQLGFPKSHPTAVRWEKAGKWPKRVSEPRTPDLWSKRAVVAALQRMTHQRSQ